MSTVEEQTLTSPETADVALPELQPQADTLDIDLLNACLFVPQAFLSRTPELTPPAEGSESQFETFSRRLQKLTKDTTSTDRQSYAIDALQDLYATLNPEAAEALPVTAADWVTINAVLFSETMAKIQTQPEWVIRALLAPLAEKNAKYNSKK